MFLEIIKNPVLISVVLLLLIWFLSRMVFSLLGEKD